MHLHSKKSMKIYKVNKIKITKPFRLPINNLRNGVNNLDLTFKPVTIEKM